MTTRAVLFDIDGTLIDSNYLHVAAWHRAFLAVGQPVPTSAIHRGMGMGSPQLLERLLGAAKAAELGDRAKEVHREAYAEARRELLQTLPGARELLRAVHGAGVRVVLSSSASAEELEDLLRVLDCDDAIHAVTASPDVETAKPAPDVVEVALEKAGATADNSLYVGDTVWDVRAAGAAGVACVGMLSGGIGEAELTEAGAVATYDDPAAMLAGLADSPLARLLG